MDNLENSIKESTPDEQRMFSMVTATALMRIYDVLMLQLVLDGHNKEAQGLRDKHARGEFEFPIIIPAEPDE